MSEKLEMNELFSFSGKYFANLYVGEFTREIINLTDTPNLWISSLENFVCPYLQILKWISSNFFICKRII